MSAFDRPARALLPARVKGRGQNKGETQVFEQQKERDCTCALCCPECL